MMDYHFTTPPPPSVPWLSPRPRSPRVTLVEDIDMPDAKGWLLVDNTSAQALDGDCEGLARRLQIRHGL